MRSHAGEILHILGRLGNLCAKLGESPRNANSRRYCQPDGDYQLPCQLHPVQGRRAHARVDPATVDHPLCPLLPRPESRARPDRNELFNYHDLSPGVSFQSIMHDRSRPGLPPFNPLPSHFGKRAFVRESVYVRVNGIDDIYENLSLSLFRGKKYFLRFMKITIIYSIFGMFVCKQ